MSPAVRVSVAHVTHAGVYWRTIDMMTTHGRFILATIARASDVFPEPELPATPMILAFPHGGE